MTKVMTTHNVFHRIYELFHKRQVIAMITGLKISSKGAVIFEECSHLIFSVTISCTAMLMLHACSISI